MYGVGGFDFPTTTGSHAVVTGLGFEPVAVIMIGSNFATVGTLMTAQTGPGVFISVNAYDYSDGVTIRSLCLSPNGNSDTNNANYRGYENGPISMQTNAGNANTVDYRADTITFDSDGFSLNVTTAASARRPIHYIAFGGEMSVHDATQLVSSAMKQQVTGLTPTFANSYEPRSAIVVGTIASNGFGEGNVNGECYYSFGSGHYPGYDPGNVETWQSSTIYTQIQISSALGRQGFTEQWVWPSIGTDPTSLNIYSTIGALGPVLNNNYRRHRPDVLGAGLSTMVNEGTNGTNSWNYAMWWNGEGWTDLVSVGAGSSTTVPHPLNFTSFEAVLFSHINGGSSSGGGTAQKFGFGVLGDSYQGCCVFGQDGSCYQSVTRAVATCTAAGANTASGVMSDASFTLTQEEGGAVPQVMWHGFGNRARPRPQIYRRVFR